jgi:hypothetical protein
MATAKGWKGLCFNPDRSGTARRPNKANSTTKASKLLAKMPKKASG